MTTWLNSVPKTTSHMCWVANFSTTSAPRLGSVRVILDDDLDRAAVDAARLVDQLHARPVRCARTSGHRRRRCRCGAPGSRSGSVPADCACAPRDSTGRAVAPTAVTPPATSVLQRVAAAGRCGAVLRIGGHRGGSLLEEEVSDLLFCRGRVCAGPAGDIPDRHPQQTQRLHVPDRMDQLPAPVEQRNDPIFLLVYERLHELLSNCKGPSSMP